MEIREARQGDVLVLAPNAAITASEDTNALESKLGAALKAGTRRVVFDCAAVSQLGSGAVRSLLTTSRRLDRAGGRLVLCGMTEKVRKAFSISGVDKEFSVSATRDEALQRVMEPVPIVAPPPRVEPKPSPAPEPAPPAAEAAAPAAEAATPPAAPLEPTPPAIDPRGALATALLNALGFTGGSAGAERPHGEPHPDLEALAAGLLTALRVRAS